MKIKEIKLLCTLGPGSLDKTIIRKMDTLGVSMFRINLSHTRQEGLEETIQFIRGATQKPICLDTEGAQIRNGFMTHEKVEFREGSKVCIYKDYMKGDANNICLRPASVVEELKVGDLISIDFDTLLLHVVQAKPDDCIAEVIAGGVIGSNKAVTVDRQLTLEYLSEKDKRCIDIGLRHGIEYVALSFANKSKDVDMLRSIVGDGVNIISKIESKAGIANLTAIVNRSDAVLIDRGDLSREIVVEQIPFIQKNIVAEANSQGVPVFVATNLLESMVSSKNPTRAEVNDIMNTLLDGANGLVLAAETAVGKYPVQSVRMVRSLVKTYARECLRSEVNEFNGIMPDCNTSMLLTEPHGGFLFCQTTDNMNHSIEKELTTICVDWNTEKIVENITEGVYSPIRGFMSQEELFSVLHSCKLPEGTFWPLPVVLPIPMSSKGKISVGESICLLREHTSKPFAVVHVQELYPFNWSEIARAWFGTDDISHPCVCSLKNSGDFFIAGTIRRLNKVDSVCYPHAFTPRQTRHIFEKKQWSTVAGIEINCKTWIDENKISELLFEKEIDGMFIQKTYECHAYDEEGIIQSNPAGKQGCNVLFGTICGRIIADSKRELMANALCKKNFGCSHIVINKELLKNVPVSYEPLKRIDVLGVLSENGLTSIIVQNNKAGTRKQ